MKFQRIVIQVYAHRLTGRIFATKLYFRNGGRDGGRDVRPCRDVNPACLPASPPSAYDVIGSLRAPQFALCLQGNVFTTQQSMENIT